MFIYDTMTRRKEPFIPSEEPITIYVCGITPYDTTHLGHAFTYVFYDVLIRYLRYRGHRTRYVQNVTDIDDDILRKARELRVPWNQLAADETRSYQEDMAALNVLPPDVYPHATQEIPRIIEIIEMLLRKGYAYRVDGNVYFEVNRDPSYGRLSRLPQHEMLPVANERGNDPGDPRKKDPLDFVLWQASAPGEPQWNSPWGAGRPGWHIECSAMALHYLGDTIDIHGGGNDLVFPHHESEIVQSENYTGRHPFVRYWVHTAMVYMDGEKMSKSLGNLVMVRQLLEQYSSDDIRILLLSHHHTEPWSYNKQQLVEASDLAAHLSKAASGSTMKSDIPAYQFEEGAVFLSAMEDDLDTPMALEALRLLGDKILRNRVDELSLSEARWFLRELSNVLGLKLTY
ncbi:MAG: cysteine--tRNA ligase [Chloroflexota bacterium]